MNRIKFPLRPRMQGPEVGNLQDALQLLLGRALVLPRDEAGRRELSAAIQREHTEQIYAESTRKVVSVFQEEQRLQASGEVDGPTANELNDVLEELGVLDQPAEPAATEYRVDGRVFSRVSAGVGGLRVQIVDKAVGGDGQIAEATTDDRGSFEARFSDSDVERRGKTQPDLQARVFADHALLGASDVRYTASKNETLNIMLDDAAASSLPSEVEVMKSAIASQYKGNLRDLKETDDQQDVTYLANKTGWDARAVALAALADQFSSRTADARGVPTIPQEFFYALFRAGLPANEDTLYQADTKTLETVWQKAAEQGVISKAAVDQIPRAIEAFEALSAQKLLTSPALIGASSFKEMLNVSRLNDAQQTRFAQLYAANRTDMPAFWKAVGEDPIFGGTADERTKVANRLQVDGKLGFLTINNATLVQNVHTLAGRSGLSDPLQLAQMGYHRAERWNELLIGDVPIPKEIPGDTAETKRASYASYLAAQVRLSYPTAAVAQMVKIKELPLIGAAAGVSDRVYAFLSEHQGKFEIGIQPVRQYIIDNKLQVADDVVQQVNQLQRVYQITPSDQAMIGLMKRGVDAAFHVVRYDRDTFVQSFATDLGGADQAALTYDRSVQIHGAVLNIALSYLYARTAPAIGVHSPGGVLDPVPANVDDVIAYATLESLFGSMDFCACEHCRSILSPAAYLVDLLQFLGSDDKVWADFVANWKSPKGGHELAPYPFVNHKEWTEFKSKWNDEHPNQPPPNTEISPFEVLTSRRPDIQHIPLTCENTNTALPYIDVVNETLEYYIANDQQKLSLKDYQGHDTNSAATEDLLASPEFVMDSAYNTLRNESFPGPLPFHQPLENLRRYFSKLEAPLQLSMERLRKSDDLERGVNPYGWRDILMEELGLSRTEYDILTTSDANEDDELKKIFGFPSTETSPIDRLSNAKKFCRRVGISYENLVAILTTRFINPDSDLIPKVERLGVSVAALKALKDGTITDSDFDKALGALAVPPDPAEYGAGPNAPKNDYTPIREWVKNNDNYARIIGLVTLAVPVSPWAALKNYVLGDCVLPTSPPAGSTLYYECTTSGTSAAAEPKWPTTPGDKSEDATVDWTCRDAASCHGFDNLAFRYSDPVKLSQNIKAVEFVRLLRFIRLWKKLGWTIEQTDAAICALYRADLAPLDASDTDDVTKLNTGFLTLLPRLGIVMRVMKALNLTIKRDLLSLLACWSDIGTHGNAALYRRMFLNPAILTQDPIFEDSGYGDFLADITKKLADHVEALRSALNLTGDEYDRIVAALGYDASTALTVPNVSAIYRRGWLARKLKISVRELLLLIELAGLDPFASPNPTNPAMLRLIFLVHALRDRSLKSAVALYLIWNQDLSGKSAPNPAQIRELARNLRGDFASIDDQFSALEDPNGDIARARITLVYGQETSDAFFALLDDTLIVDVAYTHSADTLEEAITTAYPRISYDAFRHRLSHRGLMTTVQNVGDDDFQTAVGALRDRSEEIKGLFFTAHPELNAPYNTAVAALPADRHNVFLTAFNPDLARRRKRQQALQRLSAAVGVDLVFTQTILDPASKLYPLHAAGDQSKPALEDVLALETRGLAVQFFFGDTATGNVDQSVPAAANLDYANGGSNPLPNPGNAISGIWSGQIETPEAGFYNFVIEADSEATVTLTLDGDTYSVQNSKLTKNGNIRRNSDAIELKAGTLYQIELKVEKVKDRLSFKWETPKRAREVIPSRYLDPPTILEPFSSVYARFLKAASLAMGLTLTANEMAHLATHGDYRINTQGLIDNSGQPWLNALPNADNLHLTDPAAITVAKNLNAALLTPLLALLDFARIKTEISPSDESLLTVLKDPAAATQNTDGLLFTITRCNQTVLNEVIAQFGSNIAGLGHFDLFRRVHDALAIIQMMGISAKALIEATTNDPTADTVAALQAALRALYDPVSWRDVVRPINDEMRGLQRDALVAYILHQLRSQPESEHIDTPNKLFEYFLMDVEMDACMQTSRIRHALSSVQLFIERCLMNLEPRVSAQAIKAKQWEWMKRYRVWEANRKVYFFPENWLEPELRDDKSPFFKEIESELLQSDITEDSAATALLNYLTKLEEVAKLEPCGIYHIPRDDIKDTPEINHVVARTAGAHRKYYYRRYEGGSWLPWEQIKLDIEDNPVIPVVWNDRLFLFWLRILQDTSPEPPPLPKAKKLKDVDPSEAIPQKMPKVTVRATLCWSEYYNGKWQPTKTSDVNEPSNLGTFPLKDFNRSKVQLYAWEEDSALRIVIFDDASCLWTTFLLYNTHSLPLRQEDVSINWDDKGKQWKDMSLRHLSTSGDILETRYYEKWKKTSSPDFTRDVLKSQIRDRAIEPHNYLIQLDPWDTPFFYEDRHHVFYVTTTEQPVWIPDYRKYGIALSLGLTQGTKIHPLVFKAAPAVQPKPKPWVDNEPSGPNGVDPAPMKRFVTEDAYIHQGIGTTAVVMYDNHQIGPSGAIMNVQHKE
jgi:peptidoglycan hydrolase-like protein with peptidoglycan-binding domain